MESCQKLIFVLLPNFANFLDSVSNRRMKELVCYGIKFSSVDEMCMEYCTVVGKVSKAVPHKYDIY